MPASAEELSDAGRAAPETDHAAAAGLRAATVSHTPPRRAELALVAERGREAGSNADELRPKIRRWPPDASWPPARNTREPPSPPAHAPRPENSLKRS